jgi:hypothetical protein
MITGFTKDGKYIGNSINDLKLEFGSFKYDTAKKFLKVQVDTAMKFMKYVKAGSEVGPGTPKDTGWANNNWQFSVGADCPTEPIGEYPGEGVILPDIPPNRESLATAQPFGIIYVYNNVPYIEALEDGHSTKAPMGFVYDALVATAVWLETKTIDSEIP